MTLTLHYWSSALATYSTWLFLEISRSTCWKDVISLSPEIKWVFSRGSKRILILNSLLLLFFFTNVTQGQVVCNTSSKLLNIWILNYEFLNINLRSKRRWGDNIEVAGNEWEWLKIEMHGASCGGHERLMMLMMLMMNLQPVFPTNALCFSYSFHQMYFRYHFFHGSRCFAGWLPKTVCPMLNHSADAEPLKS